MPRRCGDTVRVGREDDGDAGLGGGVDGYRAEALVGDVIAQFEAKGVVVEGQCEVGAMDSEKAHVADNPG